MSEEELPESWVECTMGDIADVVGGGTPKASDPANFAVRGHPWITPADLSRFRDVYIQRGSRDLSEQGLRKSSAKMVPAGTVLMSSRAPIGYLAIAASPVSTNQGFRSFICRPGVLPAFVYYWLMFSRAIIGDMGSGSTFNEISGSRCKEIPFRFAPLAEQKRIATKVEELLARVNAARERLVRVPAFLKHFRQAVLAAACDGRLTEGWRKAVGNQGSGHALLEKVRARRRGVMENFKGGKTRAGRPPAEANPELLPLIPETWVWASVDEISTKVVDGVHKKPDYVSTGIPFVTVRNLTAGPGLSFEVLSYVSEADHRQFTRRANPQRGDLLVSKDGTLGVVRAVRTDRRFSIFVSVALIKPVDYQLTDYLELALSSPAVQEQMTGTGSGLQHIHLRDLKEDCVPLPPLAEQVEIVRRVEALFKIADAIEKRVATATARAEKLTQAMLAKAFRGELVPTEAELARREGRTYEPASALLSRVPGESAGADTRGDVRRRRTTAAGAVSTRAESRRGA